MKRPLEYFLPALLTLAVLFIMADHCSNAEAKPDKRTDFIKGLDYGKRMLRPGTKAGDSFRHGLTRMHERYGPWCWKHMPRDYVACLSRIWLESRGNPWSHTKDVYLLEAGLTSVSQATALKLCKEEGICGDPCGDPEYSIAASAWRGARQRKAMLEDDNFWHPWLMEQWKGNRIEAEYFMSVCGGVNCQKVRKAINIADKAEGIIDHPHTWWRLMSWLRDRKPGYLEWLFDPLRISQWKFGARWGRVMGAWNIRKEMMGGQYCWGNEPYHAPTMPEPLFKYPKKGQWRGRCVLYGTKAWRQSWDEPKLKDKYKKTACRDGACWKKGERKYKTLEDYQAAWAKWHDTQQAARLLPSDKEYATWREDMREAGCTFQAH